MPHDNIVVVGYSVTESQCEQKLEKESSMIEENRNNQPKENQPQENQTEHKRRVRYRGTHPRKFEEKYKELNPEKYKQDVEKIIGQGKTPAGMHISICVNEILSFFDIQPGQVGLDATLGYGGHTQRMLEALQGQGHLYATDVDPIESEKTKARLEALGYGPEILTIRRMNFANLDQVEPGQKYDFILADLGVSSMQIDNPERGFTFKQDGPLDLRLDPSGGTTAAERLKELEEEELVGLLIENSDEPYARQIAREVRKTYRRKEPIDTTRQLYDVIWRALSGIPEIPEKERKEAVKKSCQRTFQALRIDVNSEFEVLYSFLEKLPGVLAPGGKVAVLTFHSGEDRLVKKAFKQGLSDGIYQDIAHEVIRPSAEECYQNPRAHSTKMRWAIRSEK
jgi:16S rRNA (cytosine1402-N4)-methyltransferase